MAGLPRRVRTSPQAVQGSSVGRAVSLLATILSVKMFRLISMKRALPEVPSCPSPALLSPWAASFATMSEVPATSAPLPGDRNQIPPPQFSIPQGSRRGAISNSTKTSSVAPAAPSLQAVPATPTAPVTLSPSVRQFLPLLKSQSAQYISVHIHQKLYLLTQGDIIRLPFLMHGVNPGDVLRLNRAVNFGSRDYTLKAAAPSPMPQSPKMERREKLSTHDPNSENLDQTATERAATEEHNTNVVPHFIPHIGKGKFGYLDERLFVCRAVVMGVESEPMRIKEKTKRRQRKVKKVKSKHRFTVLRVKELKLRNLEELEGNNELD